MLSATQTNKFNSRAKEVAQSLLKELHITQLDENSICDLQNELDLKVAALVSAQEEGENIDDSLLEIYDLLTDIVLDNEEDLPFLNHLFFN